MFLRVFAIGTSSHSSEKLNEKIRLNNKFAIFLTISALPYYPMFYQLKIPYTMELLTFCIVGYCATLVFNALKWNAFARVYMISFFNLMLYAYAMMFQVRTGLKLCYFATATFSFSLFRSVEWRLLVVSLLGSAFAFVAVEFGIMPGWISPIDLGDPEHPLNHAIALTALSLTIGSSLLYFAEVRNYEKKLFAASEQKSLFLSTISHEIRTPLNVIIGMTGLLGDRGLSNQEKDSYVGSIQKSSEYLLSLVNDVLDFERIEREKYLLISRLRTSRTCLRQLRIS